MVCRLMAALLANGPLQEIRMAAAGRQRQFVTIGCRHSVSKLSQSSVGARERPLSPAPTFAAVLANVKFQSGPAVRSENRRRLLWVDSGSLSVQSRCLKPVVRVDHRTTDVRVHPIGFGDRCRWLAELDIRLNR
jgi:hypothetical protein